MSTSIGRIAAERNQRALLEIVMKPGNDVCADCKARAPRWASFNLGIFICVSCASIHRKIGTHVTKVKSLTLDEWSKEQVELMRQNGNVKSNQLYNPDETRHPPPTNMIDSERDSELEKFIRAKYEFKRFMAKKSSLASHQTMVVPPPRIASVSILSRPKSTPLSTDSTSIERRTSPVPPPPPEKTPQNMPSRMLSAAGTYTSPSLSPSSTLSRHISPQTRAVSQPLPFSSQNANVTPNPTSSGKSGIWDELISLQGPTQNSSLPLQFQSHSPSTPITPLQTSVAPLTMSPTGIPSLPQTQLPSQSLPTLVTNPFTNFNMASATVTTGNPFGAMTSMGGVATPSINLTAAGGTMNPFTPQMTGVGLFSPSFLPTSPASTLTNNSSFPTSTSPFTSSVGIGTGAIEAPARQPLGVSSFKSYTMPSLVPYPTGVFSLQPQLSSPSMVPAPGTISAPPTPAPFSTFVAGSPLPQQLPYAASPQSTFGTTPFLQQQEQHQSRVQLQPQQQMFGQSGQFGGWQSRGF
ncbi:putative GTPase activating protein for Arf-domain-containing protein [Scleroderma yunnanense]